MRLISREEVEEMLRDTDELSSYAFKVLDEKLNEIKDRAVVRCCDGCMGAAFGDCGGCEKIKEVE